MKNITIEEVVGIINSHIILDEKIIVETPEHKFARGLTNSKLKEIINLLNNK